MTDLVQIKVECHAGFKVDEYPVRFFWDTIRFEIEEILDRWYQGDLNPEFSQAHYFKVKTSDGKVYILKHETNSDLWFLFTRGETLNL